ncbi:hypothetical protein NicSoilB4_30040 [Arthrobacter sp. NicSoilB4]|uniref:hypothetical protein n=1 Tax=Arthrobacter sp. NicSoilB4 TaxID=2830997 RepID=UPI001CC4C134|nr:hypothetical protein [Arthrobacter sp. NicSoilB4]BCW68241.1 hypothetical protein NicSoilB4_30040 [Arthrobacter sp. NicSoilB4]
MSNPNEVPPPQEPGDRQPQTGSVPPAGAEAPRVVPPAPDGNQPPGHPAPGYQPPPPPEYRAPGRPAGGFRFELPTDRPQNFNDAMPQGGFSGMFTVSWLPTELKVAYWIWLIGGLLGLLGGVIGLFGSFVLLAVAPGLGFLVLLLVLVALTLAAAQVILAMKMKEGREWARFALTIVAGISLLLAILNDSAADGRGGGSWPSFIISLVATVLMWLPKSQAWFESLRGRI